MRARHDSFPAPDTPPSYTGRLVRIEPGAIVVTVAAEAAVASAWVRRAFAAADTLSLAECRRTVAGTALDDGASVDAVELLLSALDVRARRGLTTAVDGPFLDTAIRLRVARLAAQHRREAVAVAFLERPDPLVAPVGSGAAEVARRRRHQQRQQLHAFIRGHASEGWTRVLFLADPDPALLPMVRFTLPDALPHPGPFDVIGDVHGCLTELDRLLDRLGYAAADPGGARCHPLGRTAVFVGDFADRGPDSAGVFRRVIAMHQAGTALAVPGNHCVKLLKHLQGRPVHVSHGLGLTLEQLHRAGPELQLRIRRFLETLPQVLALAGGRLVVFHAALPRDRVGRTNHATWAQTTYGVVLGRADDGRPIRDSAWTAGWLEGDEEPLAVYGHTPVAFPDRRGNTIDIDGGCVFGGYLAALRFPECTVVAEAARQVYHESGKVDWRGAPDIGAQAGAA